MKLLNFVALLFIALSIKAQSLKPNANQKEAIEYIQAVLSQASTALSNAEDGTLIQTFDGTTFKKVTKYSSTIFQDIYSKIDWSLYSGITKEEGKTCIYLTVKFKGNNIIWESFHSYPADHKYRPNKLLSYKVYSTHDEISFRIPYGLNSKISELEIAFRRLQSLVTGGVKLPVDYATKIKEIPGKPSFYETVKYINDFLETQERKDDDEFKCMNIYKNRKQYLAIDENMYIHLYSQYDDYYWASGTKTYKYNIPLDLVEKIIVSTKGWKGLDCFMIFLQFAENGEESKREYHLPLFKVNSAPDSLDEIKNQRIYKAFEHLRKMLGAKDPVEF